MQKFIAYSIYGTNEYGAAVTEVLPVREPKEVYLVSDVDARIAELEKALRRAEELFQDECDPVREPDSYAWLQSTRELMDI